MTPSQKCIDFIKSFEQCRLTAYMPTPKDRPTIGWGTTGLDVRMGMTWSQAQADARFARDLADFAAGVTHELQGRPTTQGQFDALVAWAYNVGMGAARASTLMKMHDAGRYAEAADQFLRWDKQAGKPLAGLTKRRAMERQIYLSDLGK